MLFSEKAQKTQALIAHTELPKPVVALCGLSAASIVRVPARPVSVESVPPRALRKLLAFLRKPEGLWSVVAPSKEHPDRKTRATTERLGPSRLTFASSLPSGLWWLDAAAHRAPLSLVRRFYGQVQTGWRNPTWTFQLPVYRDPLVYEFAFIASMSQALALAILTDEAWESPWLSSHRLLMEDPAREATAITESAYELAKLHRDLLALGARRRRTFRHFAGDHSESWAWAVSDSTSQAVAVRKLHESFDQRLDTLIERLLDLRNLFVDVRQIGNESRSLDILTSYQASRARIVLPELGSANLREATASVQEQMEKLATDLGLDRADVDGEYRQLLQEER